MSGPFRRGEPVDNENPLPSRTTGSPLKDISISSATGSSQEIAPLDDQRNTLNISNPNASESWWINETGGVAAANGAGCFELRPGSRWTPRPAPRNAVTGIAANGSALSVAIGNNQ